MEMSIPTSLILYPLTRKGERLPFASPEAEFFQTRKESSRLEFYTACLEGVGYIEKYSYYILEKLGSSPIQRVFSSGSGSNSPISVSYTHLDVYKRQGRDIIQRNSKNSTDIFQTYL